MQRHREEHHAEAGGVEKAARPQGRAQDHHPQRHAGAVHDRQPGTESAGQGRCAGRGVMRASQKGVSGANATTKASPFESEIHPSHKPSVCTLCISPCRGLPPLARRCGLGQSAQRRTALNRPCAPLSLRALADTAGGRTEA